MIDISSFNASFHLRDKGVSNALGTSALPRHRWYFIKEGFSPDIVKDAITREGLKEGDLLFDPFSGSGTVPLVGALGGLNTASIEVNPFLQFLSAAKLSNADPDFYLAASSSINRGVQCPKPSPLEKFSTFSKGNRWNRWLFPLDVLRSFEGGRQALSTVSSEYRRLLGLALIGAAMDCCNATRDGKCLRYLPKWRDNEATSEDVADRFAARVKLIAEDLEGTPIPPISYEVESGDARAVLGGNAKKKFRLCVTSPPYLNSFDYSDVYRPELFLGGFVDSNKSLREVRLKTIRSHVQASWEAPESDNFGKLYRECIEEMRNAAPDLWDPRLPMMVQAYFEDMEKILIGLRKRALSSASLWLVVSTSAYAGVEIPVDLILAEIGQRAGWFLREVGVLRYLRSSSQHSGQLDASERTSVPLRESVVIWDATRPK